MTEQVCEGAKALGLKVHDHIILGKNDHRSLRALGIIEG
jgi:DNA repair protein RadC